MKLKSRLRYDYTELNSPAYFTDSPVIVLLKKMMDVSCRAWFGWRQIRVIDPDTADRCWLRGGIVGEVGIICRYDVVVVVTNAVTGHVIQVE